MEVLIDRAWKKDGYTISRLYVDGELFGCNTLEDADRGLRQDMQLEEIKKKKVYGQTAIPRGSYECVYTYSNRFKKMLPLLLNVKDLKEYAYIAVILQKTLRGVFLSVKTIRKDGLAILDFGQTSSFRL